MPFNLSIAINQNNRKQYNKYWTPDNRDTIVNNTVIKKKLHIYNISLSITSANLTKKAICTWLAYKKNNNKHNNNDKKEL